MSGGQALITGLSLMVTVKVQLELPQELFAEHVTTVCPAGNVDPDAGEQTTVGDGVPVDVGSVHVATWLSHCTISEGQAAITGDSLIVTENEQLEVPHEFVAVHVTVEVPVGNDDPEVGKHCTEAEGVPVAVGSI